MGNTRSSNDDHSIFSVMYNPPEPKNEGFILLPLSSCRASEEFINDGQEILYIARILESLGHHEYATKNLRSTKLEEDLCEKITLKLIDHALIYRITKFEALEKWEPKLTKVFPKYKEMICKLKKKLEIEDWNSWEPLDSENQ